MGRAELDKFTWDALWGNSFSWKFVGVWFGWAYLSLIIPSAQTKGPVTDFGQVPVYQDNGVLYYWASVVAFTVYNFAVDPGISVKIYDNFPYILGCLNASAMLLCAFLLIKGRYFPDVREKVVTKRFPIAYEFYSGKELHPKLFGVDVKQLTNCRIGMIS
jgi:7-dehydrocholesterol reductase